MATWSAHSGTVNNVFSTLNSKATPEELAIVSAYIDNPKGMGKEADARFNPARDVLKKYGLSQEDADDFLGLAWNVKNHPDGTIGTFSPKAGTWGVANFHDKAGAKDPAAFMQKLQGWRDQTQAQNGAAEAEAAATKEASGVKDIRGQIQAFVDSMTGSSRADDPVRMALLQQGTDAAQRSLGQSGVRGTLAGTQAASVAQQNVLPYEAQRAQMRAQGLGMLSQHNQGLGQLQLGFDNLQMQQMNAQQARADMIAQQRYAAQAGQAQAIGGAIGMGLGTAAGAYFGMPQLGQVGGQLGGSIGGMAGPQMPNYSQGLGGAQPQQRANPYQTGGSSGYKGEGF